MGLFSFFKRKKKEEVNKIQNFQPLLDLMSNKKKIVYKEPTEYHYKRTDG